MSTISLYAFRPASHKGGPTRKTPQIESLLTYENTVRIAEEDTGVIYPNWDVAAEETGKKNIALAQERRAITQ